MKFQVIASGVIAAFCSTPVFSTPAVVAQSTVEVAPSPIVPQAWAIRLPDETSVVFRGVLNADGAGGGAGSMLYPAPNAGVALAALVVHGLLNSANRKMEANRLQVAADKVLDPYRGTISDLRHDGLFELAFQHRRRPGPSRIAAPGEAPSGDWLFVVAPVFSMTQDQRALIFDSAVLVYAPNEPAKPVFQNAVRVVSTPISNLEPLLHWGEDQGKNLKSTSAQLIAIALEMTAAEIALDPTRGGARNLEQRTIRYLEGGAEKVERSELLHVACDRALLKTLRGGLMSVPLSASHSYAAVSAQPAEACVAPK